MEIQSVFFALPVINLFSLILCYVYSFKIDRLIGSIARVRTTESRAARGSWIVRCKSFCRGVWISPLSAWPCTHIMCQREVVVCDRFVATTALFPIIDSIGPFLSDFVHWCKKKKKIERERERARCTMAENVHYIHADRPLVTHRTIKSKLNPWYIVRPRFKMERIFRDSRNSMGGQLNGQLNRKKKLGISSETLAFSFFLSLFSFSIAFLFIRLANVSKCL